MWVLEKMSQIPPASPRADSDTDDGVSPTSPLIPWADRTLHYRLTRNVHYILNGGDNPPSLTASPFLAVASKVFSVVSMSFVMISVLQLCVESLPYFTNADDPVIHVLDVTCVGFFTMEFLSKLYVAPSRSCMLKSASTAVDLISILPFYFDLVFSGTGVGNVLVVFRIVRLTQVFRVFKLSKFNQDIVKVFTTIHNSRNAISLLIFLLMIALTIFSSLIYVAEQSGCVFDETRELWVRVSVRDNNLDPPENFPPVRKVSPFQSIPGAMWWCVVTLTTVGYGDAVPVTPWGKVIASFTMLTGVLVLAFPTMILGKNFNDVTDAAFRKKQADDASVLRAMKRTKVAVKLKSILAGIRDKYEVVSLPMVRVEEEEHDGTPEVTHYASFYYHGRHRVISMVTGSQTTTALYTYTPILSLITTAPDIVHILLDHTDAHAAAHAALGPTTLPDSVSVRTVYLLTVASTNLNDIAPYASLDIGCVTTHSPSSSVPLLFSTETPSQMEDLRLALPFLTVTVRLHYVSPTVSVVHMPLTNGALAGTSVWSHEALEGTVEQLSPITALVSSGNTSLGNVPGIARALHDQWELQDPLEGVREDTTNAHLVSVPNLVSGLPTYIMGKDPLEGVGEDNHNDECVFCTVNVDVWDWDMGVVSVVHNLM